MNTVSDHPNEYGNGNGKMVYHDELTKPSPAMQQQSSNISMHSSPEDNRANKKGVIYMECLKNHAAAIGGHATDGCGEFMPGGEEGTIEALKCSACNCHRNFHRKLTQRECCFQCCHQQSVLNSAENGLTSSHHHHKGRSGQVIFGFHSQARISTAISKGRTMRKEGMTVAAQRLEKQEGVVHVETGPQEVGRKRYRTKFSQEQKEKMWSFAEKIGWKIQKLDDSTVSNFCQEIGIKKRVLKVWMHNNKHNLVKKSFLPTN